ncbi:flocculation protein FLO11-like [Gigantopelta aegis]|uniref:flocculation protein FLO11-like n=1 Tax=Gigantopelta aegis TaxID=1735272 RepID=UPI001B88BD59|nr:flocculation protein FLO11-like [Gigantopelta aegis]
MILGAIDGIPETCNWLECTMETDASIHDHMSTDEMYMVLQSDMVNIKQQEQALKTEIVSIKNKFLNLLQHCGLENEFAFTAHHVTMATAADGPTTTSSDRSTCNLHYSYADFLIEQLLASTSGLTDSDLSPSPEETRNVFDDTTSAPADQVEAHNSLNSPGNGVRNRNYDNSNNMLQVLQEANIKVLPNQLDSTTSENCVPSSASSDSYPPSTPEDLFSDNQVVPDLDLEKELMSRVKYYSDFTIDRQRKINELLNKSKNLSSCRPKVFPGENISQRMVEGAESKPACMQRIIVRRAPSSSASSRATSSSSGNSTYYPSKSKNKTSSSRASRTSSHPLMSSTLIYEPTSNLPSSSTSGDSVYTWSIDENSEPGNLEQSYLRSRHRSQRSKNRKSNLNVSRCSTRRHHRQQNQSSALHLTGLVSIIEPASCVKKDNCARNMCDDTELGFKSQTLPRTSTRINLFAADSSCSMPNVNGHPSSDSSSPLHERTELPGKSSTSEGSNYATNFGGCSTLTSMMVAPNVTECSRLTTEADSCLIDSILTDSPKSVDSSGIFAPYNSPHASSVSSRCGYTTVSSSIPSTSSNDYCDYRGPLPTPATVKASDPIFKIPHSPIARSKTCRRKTSTSRSPSVRTSTPRPFHSNAGSMHSAPAMRRKLFELNNNGQLIGEPRILDKKAIVRKFKKFSHHFKKDHTDKIKTLANL